MIIIKACCSDWRGVLESFCDEWQIRNNRLYQERAVTAMEHCRQINLIADGSTHSTRDCLVTVAWANEISAGVFAPMQVMQTGPVSPQDRFDDSLLLEISKRRKLERVAAFRQLQAISHQISILHRGRMDLASFSIAPSLGQRPVRAGESRVTFVAGEQDNEIRQCRDWLEQNPDSAGGRVPQSQGRVPTFPSVSFLTTRSQDEEITNVFPVLPESDRWWLNIPILVLGLDQGSIGLAGMAFAMRDNMVHVKCDKIHRAIRDFKNSMSRCLKGLFLKAQLHSSYIFALNYKPFGSGGFFSQKREMLEKFISTTSPQDSPIWDAFREKIARDLGRELSGDDHEIQNMLADVDSFMKKGSLVKASRWFSWNQLCCEQLCEFHVLKMLLANQFGEDEPCSPMERERCSLHSLSAQTEPGKAFFEGRVPESDHGERQEDAVGDLQKLSEAGRTTDPRKELSLLKSSMGGFKLAYYLMTEDLFDHSKILYKVTEPLWTWYGKQVKNVKSPQDGRGYTELMTVCDSWKGDKHLVQMVSNLQNTELWKEHFDTDLQEPAEKIMMLTLHLLMNRVWTCSLFSLPPDAYVGLLSCDAEIRKTTALKAECHHKSLLRFESTLAESIPSVHARQLFTDLQVGISHPSRLFLDTLEAQGYEVETPVSEVIDMGDVETQEMDDAMDDSLPSEADIGGGVGIILEEEEGRVPARRTANILVPACPATHLLNVLVHTLPDSKIVEDVHNKIRNDALLNKTRKQTNSTIQSVIENSNVFESRSIRHPAKVKRAYFEKEFWNVSRKRQKLCFRGCRHQLPAMYTQIVGDKTWNTLSEETFERASAAWSWLTYYNDEGLANLQVPLRAGKFSNLAVPFKILKHCVDHEGRCYLSLGAKTWAALMWPVVEREDESTSEKYFVLKAECQEGDRVEACWVHLYEPEFWEVLETEPVFWNGIICLRLCQASPEPLLAWILQHSKWHALISYLSMIVTVWFHS